MQETGKVFYKLICVDSHIWEAEAHSLTCTVAVMDSGPFFCIQPLAGVLGTATGHWCFTAGGFLTWLTSVMTCSCCDWIWSTGWCLQRHPSSFSLCNLQTQIFCSTVMQSQGMTVYPQSTVAIGLAGGRSAVVQSRLFLCWLFLVVFQQVRILWLLAPWSPVIWFSPSYIFTLLLFWLIFTTCTSSPSLTSLYMLNCIQLVEISAGVWGHSWKWTCCSAFPLGLFTSFYVRVWILQINSIATMQQGENFPQLSIN